MRKFTLRRPGEDDRSSQKHDETRSLIVVQEKKGSGNRCPLGSLGRFYGSGTSAKSTLCTGTLLILWRPSVQVT